MHEYGLMQDVVDRALQEGRARGGGRVVRVRIQVGEFALASRESLQTAYEILVRGTSLESSILEMSDLEGRAACAGCGFAGSARDLDAELSEPPALLLCPRCGSPLLVTAGAGIALIDVQLEDRGRPTERDPAGEVR